jgi:hypothetical protein
MALKRASRFSDGEKRKWEKFFVFWREIEMMNRILGLSLAGIMALTANAWADTSAAAPAAASPTSSSSTSEFFSKLRKNIRGSYINEFSGPYVRAPSGNLNGDGTNLQMIHYISLSYILGSKWRVGITQPAYMRIDEKPATEVDPFEPTDPYITFTNTRVIGSERYGTNLYAYLRYYVPVSKSTINGANDYSVNDRGNGQVRFTLIPSVSLLGGALNLSGATFVQYRIAKHSSQERAAVKGDPKRNDMVFVFDPILTYTVNDTVEAYLEYAFDMTHSTDGKWTSWKKQDYVSPGLNLQLTKKLMVNPYFVWEPRLKELRNTAIGVTAIYAFL